MVSKQSKRSKKRELMNIDTIQLSNYDVMYYDDHFTCHVLVWGETISLVCVDLDIWKDVRTVDTASLHKTSEAFCYWKYNEQYKLGTLIGFHMTSLDFGIGIILEVVKAGWRVKLLVGEETRTFEHHRLFKLDQSKYPQGDTQTT